MQQTSRPDYLGLLWKVYYGACGVWLAALLLMLTQGTFPTFWNVWAVLGLTIHLNGLALLLNTLNRKQSAADEL